MDSNDFNRYQSMKKEKIRENKERATPPYKGGVILLSPPPYLKYQDTHLI